MIRAHVGMIMAMTVMVTVGCGGSATPGGTGGGGSTTGSTGSGGAGGGGGSGGGQPFALCPTQHVITTKGHDVIVCDTAFDEAPFVHLPPAEAGPPHVDYVSMRACGSFVDRQGKQLELAPGLPSGSLCDDTGGLPNDEALGHAFALYRATLDDQGRVSAFTRWAVIDEKNLLRVFAGRTLEGKISAKNGDTFDFEPALPLRLSLGQPAVLTEQADGTTVYQIPTTIQNLSEATKGSDGSCLPALAGSAKDPFPGAKQVTLSLYRVPSMHGSGDDELVIEYLVDQNSAGSTMGQMWYFGPESLFLASPGALPTYDGIGHGTPGSLPNLKLTPVEGGGGACSP